MLTKHKRKIKYLFIRLLRVKGKAHRIALGFSIGLVINFIPSFGIGPILSTGLARVFRGNSVAGFIGGISIIWAFPILFYLNVLVGEALFPIEVHELDEGLEHTEEAVQVGLQIGKAFIVGMFINVLVSGVISYLIIYTIYKNYRRTLLELLKTKKIKREAWKP